MIIIFIYQHHLLNMDTCMAQQFSSQQSNIEQQMRTRNTEGHHTKQQLGKTIGLYLPPQSQPQHSFTGFHSKPRSPNPTNHRLNNNQVQNHGAAQYATDAKQNRTLENELKNNYHKLEGNFKMEKQNFSRGILGLQKVTMEYYKQLRRLLNQEERQVMQSIEYMLSQMEAKFHSQIDEKIKIMQISCLKYPPKNSRQSETLRAQLNKIATFDVPVFKIDLSHCYKNFEMMMKQYRPVFLDSSINSQQCSQSPIPCCLQRKQNISINQSQVMQKKSRCSHLSPSSSGSPSSASCDLLSSEPSTIKKSSHANFASTGHNAVISPICEFSCEEQLRWNPDEVSSNRFEYEKGQEKKDMVSEVIMEEPSSCEDSVLLSDSKEVY